MGRRILTGPFAMISSGSVEGQEPVLTAETEGVEI